MNERRKEGMKEGRKEIHEMKWNEMGWSGITWNEWNETKLMNEWNWMNGMKWDERN